MAQAQAQRLRIFNSELKIVQAFQSYWVGTRVEGHSFLTYDTGVITTSNTGDAQTLDVSFPATGAITKLVDDAYRLGYIFETEIIQFDADEGPVPPPYYTIAKFIGKVETAGYDGTTITVTLGSSLNPVGAQVPPRRFTTDRIGTPLRS